MTVTQADKDAANQWRSASDGRVQEPLEVILARHRIEARRKALEDAADMLDLCSLKGAAEAVRAMIEGEAGK